MSATEPYRPETSGLYSIPDQRKGRVISGEAEKAMILHRPETAELPTHRWDKLWDVVAEIDMYEEARMLRDGLLQRNESNGLELSSSLLSARGHQNLAHYLAYERNYPYQVDHAVFHVRGGYADGQDPADVAHIGRATAGLDHAGLAADYEADPEGPITPDQWMDLYSELHQERAMTHAQAEHAALAQEPPQQGSSNSPGLS